MTPKRVLILGSTGSIGQNSLEVLAGLRDRFEVVGLAAHKNADVLSHQIRTWCPKHVAMTDTGAAAALRASIDPTTQVLTGPRALVDLVDTVEFDCVIVAVVGAAGLPATIRAVELGKRVAIANKESLVVAGPLLTDLARRTGAELIPIDSEHSAVFQAMHAGNPEDVARIVLTGSGGPFRTWTPDRVAAATLEDALNHPIWDMGPKITIDSATMMNKALEIVEARWLFGLNPDQIDDIIHPESIIHSMVEFRDGSVIAQMGTPDMRTPIQYALTYPERRPCPSPRLDFAEIGQMRFERPNSELFSALRIGHEVARRGGTSGAVFSAANESAVQLFRDGEIGFADITRAVEQVLSRHEWDANPTLDVLLSADAWARDEVHKCTAC